MNYEKNIPTEQDKKKKITRLPCKNGDQRRTQSIGTQKTERSLVSDSIGFSYKKEMHVRKKWEFNQIRHKGQKYYGRFICFQYMLDAIGPSKLGLTVSRKYGNAIKRNFFKRRMKEFFRCLNKDFSSSIKLNILPLVHTKNASFEDLKNDWESFVAYLNKGS